MPIPLDPIQLPYPRWYDPNIRCEYHDGATGHPTDNCEALRGRVQSLIRNGWLKIEGNGSTPNVTSNPLPHHDSSKGNGVIVVKSQDESLVTEVDLLVPYFGDILAMAMSEGYIHPYGHEFGNNLLGSGCQLLWSNQS